MQIHLIFKNNVITVILSILKNEKNIKFVKYLKFRLLINYSLKKLDVNCL
jgi:hypothetical protein